MFSARNRLALVAAMLVAGLIAACGPRPPDDGHLFLVSYASEWRIATPLSRSGARPTPLPYATQRPEPTPAREQFPAFSPPTATAPPRPRNPTRPAPPTPADSAAPTATLPPGPTPMAPPAPASHSLVFLDPGHGGVDQGATGFTIDGSPVAEKNLTLAIALKTAARLRADGVSVTLSRSGDGLAGSTPADYSPDGNMLTPDGVLADLQRRIDHANASGARVFLSIHLNAYSDPSIGGSETFYDSARPFADQNQRFAQLVQSSLISALRAQAYTTPDRGITDDASLQTEDLGVLQGTYNHLILLGPPVPGRVRPTEMPGALSEPMFVSDPDEATALNQPDVQDLLAGAYVRAIEQFLKSASA